MTAPDAAPPAPPAISAARFGAIGLIMGFLGFGGGYVVIGRLKRALVDDRKWLGEAEFIEDVAVANALPGTIAANLLTLLGYRLGGLRSALAATFLYVTPSVVLMGTFAVLYDQVRSLRMVESALDGMSAAMVGVVAAVVLELRRGSIRSKRDWLVAVPAAVTLATRALTLLEVVVLAGMVGLFGMRPRGSTEPGPRAPKNGENAWIWLVPAIVGGALPAAAVLFLVFAKIGIVTFGGGLA
ncbi:MAG: chromate transporter, partial [Polyangiaceae bacterium]